MLITGLFWNVRPQCFCCTDSSHSLSIVVSDLVPSFSFCCRWRSGCWANWYPGRKQNKVTSDTSLPCRRLLVVQERINMTKKERRSRNRLRKKYWKVTKGRKSYAASRHLRSVYSACCGFMTLFHDLCHCCSPNQFTSLVRWILRRTMRVSNHHDCYY